MPFADATFDVVVMSEVIEHLLRPERAVWEIARVLKPGGVFVMTTNNASEVPLWSPLTHLFAWLEKAFGAYHPSLISRRPWVWPHKMDRSILPPDAPDVWLPHTHHIYAETRDMFAAAGLDAFDFSTFEFPPPQAKLSAWLDVAARRAGAPVDVIEAVVQRLPLVNRLGCHMFVLARKNPSAGCGPSSDRCVARPVLRRRRRGRAHGGRSAARVVSVDGGSPTPCPSPQVAATSTAARLSRVSRASAGGSTSTCGNHR